MRLFVALPLSADMRSYGDAVQQLLRSRGVRGKYVAPANLHVTMQFLADVDEVLLDSLTVELARATRQLAAFELVYSGLGGFGRPPRHVHMHWDSAEFAAAVHRLEQASAAAGLAAEASKKPPIAHATLVRFRGSQESWILRDLVDIRTHPWLWQLALPPAPTLPMLATQVILVQSVLSPRGPVYSVLEQFKLVK